MTTAYLEIAREAPADPETPIFYALLASTDPSPDPDPDPDAEEVGQ